MILRRIQPKKTAEGRIQVSSVKSVAKSTELTPAARKPSERFTRKTLVVRSKSSVSERVRVADLRTKLEKELGTKDTQNGNSNFNGYRPGCSGPPG